MAGRGGVRRAVPGHDGAVDGAALMDVAPGAIVAAVAPAGFFAALAGLVPELYAGAARSPGAGPGQAQ
jgi:hypothetical protein